MSGVSPTVVVPQEQAQQTRNDRAQQQQQAMALQTGMAAVQGAKTLSEAKTADPNLLTALASAVGGQQQ